MDLPPAFAVKERDHNEVKVRGKAGGALLRFAVVVNAKAGLASRMGARALRALMDQRLGPQLGHLRVIRPTALADALTEAVALKPDAILVLGGDGTARSAAGLLYPTRIPAAFLPGGTMNILPKRLYGDMPLEAVLETIAAGGVTVKEIETGLANDEPFFVAASFGYLPLLAVVREKHRAAMNLIYSLRVVGRILRFGPRLFRPHLLFNPPDGPSRLSAALIVSLGSADVLHPLRANPATLDSFEGISLDVQGWWSLAGLTAKALVLPDWRQDPRVTPFRAERLLVQSGPRLRATLDGEPVTLQSPLSLSVAKSGLRVLSLPVAREPR